MTPHLLTCDETSRLDTRAGAPMSAPLAPLPYDALFADEDTALLDDDGEELTPPDEWLDF